MTTDHAYFYFDFVDPGSYLLHLQLKQLNPTGSTLRLVGMELALPPGEMIDPTAPEWLAYCDDVDKIAAESGLVIPRVDFVPWSRKAHELLLHAAANGVAHAICEALFRAHFSEAQDLGRVDVLIEIARVAGLDFTETKAVLDVDKFTEALDVQRHEGIEAGIIRVPTVRFRSESLVGPGGIHDLRTLFESPGGPITGT